MCLAVYGLAVNLIQGGFLTTNLHEIEIVRSVVFVDVVVVAIAIVVHDEINILRLFEVSVNALQVGAQMKGASMP